jgi:protein TonB
MATLRIPFAFVSGLLFSLAAFFGLWRLVSVPFEARAPAIAHDLVFTPQRRPAPPENKRDPKVKRTPPPIVKIVGEPGWTDTGVTRTAFDPPRVAVDPPRTGGLSIGSDRDVLPLVRVNPEYPPGAIAGNIEGWVQVQFSVTATGSVRDAVVVASEPGTIFDDAALKAVARWRYNPRVEGGVAAERVGLQTMLRFKLEN